MRNLHRAAELISSFKQIAVDQISAQRRPFGLKEIVSEIIITLRPIFKNTPYTIETDIPDDIHMDSYPGPLGQILSNLISNAIIHGFGDRMKGAIHIRAHQTDAHQVKIEVRDDGEGIPPANIKRLFDPFFTTKLGQGGSGLGLHIVYNLVTEVLGGKVTVESTVGVGTVLILSLPLVAPAAIERTGV